jgi:hypothetical protein
MTDSGHRIAFLDLNLFTVLTGHYTASLTTVTDCEDLATEGNPSYLTRKAVELIAMEKVADGGTLAIDLPAVLTSNTLDVTPELNDHLASCFLQLMGI